MTRERLMHTSLVIRMYDIDFLQRRNQKTSTMRSTRRNIMKCLAQMYYQRSCGLKQAYDTCIACYRVFKSTQQTRIHSTKYILWKLVFGWFKISTSLGFGRYHPVLFTSNETAWNLRKNRRSSSVFVDWCADTRICLIV